MIHSNASFIEQLLQDSNLPTGWTIELVEKIAKRGSGHTPDRKQPEYWNGGVKWVSLADSDRLDNRFISETTHNISEEGIANSSAVKHPSGVVIVSRDAGVGKSAITTDEMAVSQHFIAWDCGSHLHNLYLYYWLQLMKPEFERVAIGSTIKTIGLPYFQKLAIILPPLPEQRAIAAILSTWDEAITLTAALIDALKRRKVALMSLLLTGKVRFAEFVRSDETQETEFGEIPLEWKYSPIGEIADSVSERNADGGELPVLSCTKYDGLVDSLSYFGRQIFSDDLSTYKIVRSGQFAYATNHIEEGSIGYQDLYDAALISPMYTVFETTDEVHDPFLYAVLKTELYRTMFEKNTSASVDRRGSLRWSQFSRIKVPLPQVDEQLAISNTLETAQGITDSYEHLLESLQTQKRGLMQQLLTGAVRVKVEDGEDNSE